MRNAALAALVAVVSFGAPGAVAQAQGERSEYVVLYRAGSSSAAARQAISSAGGEVVRENTAIGVATVTSSNAGFLASVARQGALDGAARNRPVGYAPDLGAKRDPVEGKREAPGGSAARAAAASGPDPLSPLQWDMKMIRATSQGSYAVQRGDKRVLVGIMDTGIDGSHPDIAPNFDKALSRNFTTDIPLIDGPCQDEPDHSCHDPVDVDEDGHGTHVAGIVGAAINGLGIAGVAPNITLVNIRAGQDSGFFFLQETVDALTYAGDIGIDVVNMSFFTDPWLYNCPNNPADSPAEQLEQRTIIAATQRALDYAHNHNVTLVAALGNEHTDLGHPTTDDISPDFPPGTEKHRAVDNSCLDMPTEGNHVIAVSSLGPSTAKADYSNYGLEQTDVSAPGGFFRDLVGTSQFRTTANLILSAYPESVARATGDIDDKGLPTNEFVLRSCRNGVCGYYQYLQGTSMAAPHATGVAALIVSQFGYRDFAGGRPGLALRPSVTESILEKTATDHPCPEPRLVSYANVDRPPDFDALCQGTPAFNGFYGNGIVDALSAVTLRPRRFDRL